MHLLLPKLIPQLDPNLPLFFLLGPVLGGDDWQAKAAQLIRGHIEDCYIAIPNRYEAEHPLMHLQPTEGNRLIPYQLTWERILIESSLKRGCAMFWLPEESATNPRPKEMGPYARDTYGELGRWGGHLRYESKAPLVIGGEPGFSGLDVIRRNMSADVGYDFPIYSSLEDTVRAAVQRATRQAFQMPDVY